MQCGKRIWLYTAKQVAALFGWALQHVYYLIRMGKLIAVKAGSKWRIVPNW